MPRLDDQMVGRAAHPNHGDLSDVDSKPVGGFLGSRLIRSIHEVVQAADVVITMGCGDACPVYPGKRYLDWELPDPAEKPLEEVRPIRNEVERRVLALLWDLTAGE